MSGQINSTIRFNELCGHRDYGNGSLCDTCWLAELDDATIAALELDPITDAALELDGAEGQDQAPAAAAPSWSSMRRADFDAAAPLVLFELDQIPGPATVRPDACGTPDLFTEA